MTLITYKRSLGPHTFAPPADCSRLRNAAFRKFGTRENCDEQRHYSAQRRHTPPNPNPNNPSRVNT